MTNLSETTGHCVGLCRKPPVFHALQADTGNLHQPALEELPEGKGLPGRVEISLSFLSPDEMREQNRAYRDVDAPTDVLSFPLWEEDGVFRPDITLPVLPLGDILICPEYVRSESEGEEACGSAMALMLAHGFLHLLAWDHDTPEREKTMEEVQERIRAALIAGEQG